MRAPHHCIEQKITETNHQTAEAMGSLLTATMKDSCALSQSRIAPHQRLDTLEPSPRRERGARCRGTPDRKRRLRGTGRPGHTPPPVTPERPAAVITAPTTHRSEGIAEGETTPNPRQVEFADFVHNNELGDPATDHTNIKVDGLGDEQSLVRDKVRWARQSGGGGGVQHRFVHRQ